MREGIVNRGSPRRRWMGLIIVTVLSAVAALNGGAVASATSLPALSGEGSTWPQGALDVWKRDLAVNSGQTVDYAGIGPTAAEQGFFTGRADFAVSETPFGSAIGVGGGQPATPFAYASAPAVAGGTALMYNLRIDGHRVTTLRLSGASIAKIFTGVIVNWNDPRLKADNPGLTMPDQTIQPVVRADSSGSTLAFTAWMSKQHPALWAAFAGRSAPLSLFPSAPFAKTESGSLGVAGYVSQSYGDGAITYVENSYALSTGFPVAKVLNAAGYYVAPTADAVAIALSHAYYDPGMPPSARPTLDLDDVYANSDSRSYPLSGVASLIVPTETTTLFTGSKAAALRAFGNYVLCEGQTTARVRGYAPLPRNLVSAALDQLARIPGTETAVVDITACSSPNFVPGDSNSDTLLLRTAAPPDAADMAPGGVDPASVTRTGSHLRAITGAAADGDLQLVTGPTTIIEFGAPYFVNGLSTSQAQLPKFTVIDTRWISRPGWDLVVNVAAFVNRASPEILIDESNVGVRPQVIGDDPEGLVSVAEQRAGGARYPAIMASASGGHGAGTSSFSGLLTLVSPADKPAGEYLSTLTVTVTSR